MKKFALLTSLGVALLMPAASQAAEKSTQTETGGKISNKTVRLCFTCGGATPFRRLTINLNGTGNRVLEFGSGCGGGLAYRFDNRPYVCSN